MSRTEDERGIVLAANRIADTIESGILPWSRPSRLGFACGLPADARTGRPYTGMLTWLLEIAAIERGYRSRFWATPEDWAALGGTILRDYGDTLFNGDQIRVDLDEPPRRPDYDRARRLVDATGARIRPSLKPYYRRIGDRDWIGMPPEDWDECAPGEWWSVLFHELIHWAVYGTRRLGRDCEDALGELIAEMGAAMLADRFGIAMRGDIDTLQNYVGAWVEGIRADEGYLTSAYEVASIAAVYILVLGGEEPFARTPAPTGHGKNTTREVGR